jgi:hypothetical protein
LETKKPGVAAGLETCGSAFLGRSLPAAVGRRSILDAVNIRDATRRAIATRDRVQLLRDQFSHVVRRVHGKLAV